MATNDSYFASLGRQELAPFTDEKLIYEDPNPNAEEGVNKSIDRNIRVRTRDFAQHIQAYNAASKYSSIDLLKDVTQFATSAKTAVNKMQAYNDNEADYDEVMEAGKDPKLVSRFAGVEKKYTELKNQSNSEIEKEIARIEETGEDSTGTKYSNSELLELKKMISTEDIRSGRAAVKNMHFYLPQYLEIAKGSLVVNGKLFGDMTTAEKQQWWRIAGARYIEIWTNEFPQISKGQLISDFIPKWNTRIKSENSQSFSAESQAVNTINQGNTDQYYFDTIKVNADKHNNPDYTEPIGDEIYQRDGFIERRAGYWKEKGYGKNSMKKANEEWVLLVKRGIDNNVFDEQDIQYILEDMKFVPKGSTKKTDYQHLQKNNANEIRNHFNDKKKEESLEAQQGKLQYLEGRFEHDDIEVTMEMISTIHDSTLRTQALKLVERSRKNVFDRPEFDSIKTEMSDLTTLRSRDSDVFGKDVRNGEWQIQKGRQMYKDAGEFFIKEYKRLEKLGVDDPLGEATQLTRDAINNKQFDKKVDTTTPDDTKIAIAKLTQVYRDDNEGAISAKTVHKGEEPFIEPSLDFFKGKTDKLPGYWRSVSHLYKNKSSIKLAHDRLVALGQMDPIPELMGDVNLGLTNPILIDDKPSANKVDRIATENQNGDREKILTAITDPKDVDNGGIDAIKKDNKYTTLEKPLSEHTIDEVIDLIEQGYDNFGLYGITAEGLKQVLASIPKGHLAGEALFNEAMQQEFVLARLRFKGHNKVMYAGADQTWRRLTNIPKEDREAYRKLFNEKIGELPPFLDPSNMCAACAKKQIENTLD
jgi:hypothetical protein